ncbi:hypothetical protein GGS26DRAFT_319459 [Hypomontagnella submonticulosa]|nr:hypothetical protein GGS26DRAFT_319459 [Hypomontagnella submonticulosa]
MNEGSYNNVVRSNSPFSPMTPSTPSTYKTNVNRTKTKKWVEAKAQNYDGDDWGNEYEEDYDEPEPEPQPAPRVAALRQQSRSSSQPPATTDSRSRSPLAMRTSNNTPSLHIQTGFTPGFRPPDTISSAPSQGPGPSSRFPLRESSMSRQELSSHSDMDAPRPDSRPESSSSTQPQATQRAASPSGTVSNATKPSYFVRPADIYSRVEEEREKERRSMESSRASMEGGRVRGDGVSSPANVRSSTEQRRGTSFESNEGSDNAHGLKQTPTRVDEQKSRYGMEHGIASPRPGAPGDETEADQGRVNPPRLSTSPKLPNLARLSGFGDDLFSTTGGNSSPVRPSLSPIPDDQHSQTDVANAKLGPSTGPDDKRRTLTGFAEEKYAPSVLDGPKLEPNPHSIMPPLEPKKEDPANTMHQPASRPQLPGTWVSETVSAGSELPTPAERAEGPGPTSLRSIANSDVSPMKDSHAEPDDLEPTTTVRKLPSTAGDSGAIAADKITHESGENDFNSPTGKHDQTVASKVVAAGPGRHPTPQSLPHLKTDNPLASSDTLRQNEQEASKAKDMAPPYSNYKSSPSQLSSAQQSSATTGPVFPPTAPLNPRRSFVASADLATPVTQGRKSTMSTVDTASPEKESDKLREEIIKSLSASPTITPDASMILGSSGGGAREPTPGMLTRESTYLSGVYDDYLAPAEEKSLQETGQILKQGVKLAGYGDNETESTPGPNLQKETFPDIAPLSPHRSPEQQNARRPTRRFSWEDDSEKTGVDPVETKPSAPVLAQDSTPSDQRQDEKVTVTEPNTAATSPNVLHIQAEGTGTISHQVSQVSSRAPGDQSSTTLEPPSPDSRAAEQSPPTRTIAPGGLEASRLSLAEEKEKVLVQSSSNTSSADQHPALVNPVESAPSSSPSTQPAPVAHSIPQAKVMAFRDILNLVSIDQRIQKFDETRGQFYSMDSGLSNWLAYMYSQPDHGITATIGMQPSTAQGQMPSFGAPAPNQQPYYQQYLNASNPGAPPAPPGRVSTGNLQHMFTGQPMSSFGSSSNQVGAKSKELLQAAGAFGNKGMKSGMKLFNKGKNKLRAREGR